jgi:DNA-binding transcriptional MocR family regulator
VSRPLPALKSLDRDDRVLYAGTFSKVLFPAIRLAYLVVPLAQVERFEQTARLFSSGSPALTQHIVADFMAEGHFAHHIQRMRRLYGERRALASAGLEEVLQPYLQVQSPPGGMHLLLRLQGRRSITPWPKRCARMACSAAPCPNACWHRARACHPCSCSASPTSRPSDTRRSWASASWHCWHEMRWPSPNHHSWHLSTGP